jgi:hypothetical protein
MCRKCQVDNCSCNSVISKSGEKGDRGPQGFSAYQIAVANGFVGTEEEWLASLAGGTFLALSDTPNSYVGQSGRVPTVNLAEDGLDFTVLPVELTTDELAAINGANTPNALNVFATIGDLPTLVSELTNDSGFITSAPNFANTDLTFTGNRTHNIGVFTLSFNGTIRVISPGAGALDTAFSVRNFGDTDYMFSIFGDNEARFKVNSGHQLKIKNATAIYGVSLDFTDLSFNDGATNRVYVNNTSFINNVPLKFKNATSHISFEDQFSFEYARFQDGGVNGSKFWGYNGRFGGDKDTTNGGVNIPLTVVSPSALYSGIAASIRNSSDLGYLMTVRGNGVITMEGSQVGNVGLVSGDTYFDTAANILANGDLIMGRKV